MHLAITWLLTGASKHDFTLWFDWPDSHLLCLCKPFSNFGYSENYSTVLVLPCFDSESQADYLSKSKLWDLVGASSFKKKDRFKASTQAANLVFGSLSLNLLRLLYPVPILPRLILPRQVTPILKVVRYHELQRSHLKRIHLVELVNHSSFHRNKNHKVILLFLLI